MQDSCIIVHATFPGTRFQSPTRSQSPTGSCHTVSGGTGRYTENTLTDCYVFSECHFVDEITAEYYGTIDFRFRPSALLHVCLCTFLRSMITGPVVSYALGACVFAAYVRSVRFFGFEGMECSGSWESFVKTMVVLSTNGTIELNESFGVRGSATAGNSFSTEFRHSGSGHVQVIRSLNSTFNSVA
jgi:hypothetical protein